MRKNFLRFFPLVVFLLIQSNFSFAKNKNLNLKKKLK